MVLLTPYCPCEYNLGKEEQMNVKDTRASSRKPYKMSADMLGA